MSEVTVPKSKVTDQDQGQMNYKILIATMHGSVDSGIQV
jgi:hypothetical protein